MKCLVLGAGGFMGAHLCKALIDSEHEVLAFSKSTSDYIEVTRKNGAKIILGDFLNPTDVALAISSCDIVFHLISTTTPERSNKDITLDITTNVFGTLRMLDLARKARVRKIIFVSSGGTVYGVSRETPISENHPTNPISSYGVGKLTIEKYLHIYWKLYGLDYCILRVSNAYGENQPVHRRQGFISTSLFKAIHDNELTIWGDGSVVRDYIYIQDVVEALIKTIDYHGEEKIFNIGTGQGHSIQEVLNIIKHTTQCPLRINYLPVRQFDVPVNILDISLAKIHLGWQPSVEISEGILKTFHWVKKLK